MSEFQEITKKITSEGDVIHYKTDSYPIKYHNLYGPAIIRLNGTKEWWVDGIRNHPTYFDYPTIVCLNGDKMWHYNNKLHRIIGPAVIKTDGIQEWYFNGLLHNSCGPAITYPNGIEIWYFNGYCHRMNKPAVIIPNKIMMYVQNNLKHRRNGPAIIMKDGRPEWWINGIKINESKVQEYLNNIYKEGIYYMNTTDQYLYKNNVIHSEYGPAILKGDNIFYYNNGLKHRYDGPAVIYKNNKELNEYWIYGNKYSGAFSRKYYIYYLKRFQKYITRWKNIVNKNKTSKGKGKGKKRKIESISNDGDYTKYFNDILNKTQIAKVNTNQILDLLN